MKLLSDSIADDADFFVEQIHLVAIVFDNTDDVNLLHEEVGVVGNALAQ